MSEDWVNQTYCTTDLHSQLKDNINNQKGQTPYQIKIYTGIVMIYFSSLNFFVLETET